MAEVDQKTQKVIVEVDQKRTLIFLSNENNGAPIPVFEVCPITGTYEESLTVIEGLAFLFNNEPQNQRLIKKLVDVVDAVDAYVPLPPDRNCSCHINPPCSDCVDHGAYRELFECVSAARSALKEAGV